MIKSNIPKYEIKKPIFLKEDSNVDGREARLILRKALLESCFVDSDDIKVLKDRLKKSKKTLRDAKGNAFMRLCSIAVNGIEALIATYEGKDKANG